MKENKMTAKEQREVNLIVENLELIKVLMRVFGGQVLYTDLQEFCIKFNVVSTEDAFEYAVEKLVGGKVLKRTTYPNTSYIVLVAKLCVNKYINGIDDSIDFSAKQVRLNCFRNSLMVKEFERPDCSLDKFLEIINCNSTFLHSKNDIENGYQFFKRYFDINETGEQSYKCALYRKTKGLSCVKTIGNEGDELESYKNSFATFVNKNVYTLHSNGTFTFYILDVHDNLNSEKTAKKIGNVIGTLYEQVEQLSLIEKLDNVNFVIIARDGARQEKITNTFRQTYYKEHITAKNEKKLIKAYKEHLLEATNTAVNKRVNNIKVKYTDKDRESEDVIMFKNNYETQYGLNLVIRVVDADLNNRLNMHTRVANINLARKIRQEKELKEKLRREIEEDIRKEYENLYSAKEEEIKRRILAEHNLPLYDMDEDGEEYL